MDPKLIKKRIAAIDGSTGSIIGTAAWIGIQCGGGGGAADTVNAIVQAIADKIQQPPPSTTTSASLAIDSTASSSLTTQQQQQQQQLVSSTSATAAVTPTASPSHWPPSYFVSKTACLYALHEVLISCAVHAVSEVGRQLICAAIASKVPAAVRRAVLLGQAVCTAEGAAAKLTTATVTTPSLVTFPADFIEFLEVVLKTTAWWNTAPLINYIPKDRLKEMRSPVLQLYAQHGLGLVANNNNGNNKNNNGSGDARRSVHSAPFSTAAVTVAVGGGGGGCPATTITTTAAINPSASAGASSAAAPSSSSQPHLPSASAVGGLGQGQGLGQLPKALQGVVRLVVNYEKAKERFDDLFAKKVNNTNNNNNNNIVMSPEDAAELEEAREEAIRRLIFALKALDGREGGGGAPSVPLPSDNNNDDGSLLPRLYADLLALQSAASSVPAPAMDDKDDLLGSFF